MLDTSPQVRVGGGQRTPAPPAPPRPPWNQEEIQALAATRIELGDQLEALTERREEVADQLHGAEMAARPGLIARLSALDERIARLEQEVLQADDAIAAAVSAGVIAPPSPEQTETQEAHQWDIATFQERAAMLMAGEALLFLLLGIVLYKLGWARAKARFAGTQPNDPRIDQLQNSVDAIAVEVERISEGQRYVSKLLNEGAQPDVVATGGQEEAIPVRRKAT